MTSLASSLREAGYFSALDRELARTLGRLAGEADAHVLLGVALSSRQVRGGHVCADLARLAGAPVSDESGEVGGGQSWPALAEWLAALRRSPLVSDGSRPTPLVLDARHRLYLARYFQHERALAEQLLSRAQPRAFAGDHSAVLRRLFGDARGEPDAQRLAAMVSALSGLSLIYGGPGTGKTSTVVKLLALLSEGAAAPPRALLLGPTGKAAARLSEAVERALGALDVPAQVRASIPTRASTIHRALGVSADDATRVRHDRSRPLPSDLVVVDEASMVDVALMRRLVEAVHPAARLILLGDANQLASVEAGAVLGDICSGASSHAYSAALARRAKDSFGEALRGAAGQGTPLRDCMVELEKSHRFDERSGIGSVALAVKRGEAARAVSLLSAGHADVRLVDLGRAALEDELGRALVQGFGPVFRAKSAARALDALEKFRLLAAHRRGARGVEGLNRLAERVLAGAGLLSLPSAETRFYAGRPVMVVENDYQLELFNGDVGVLWPGPGGVLAAHFADRAGATRQFSPSRLPPHETVFATSIHKSQGSELDEVAIVLPESDSPLLSRELFYTALTRARRRAVVYGSADDVARAIERRVRRDSGLAELLWGAG